MAPGAGGGGGVHSAHCGSTHRDGNLRSSQRNLHRAAFYQASHRSHALGLRHRPAHRRNRVSRQTRAADRSGQTHSRCSITCNYGTGTPFTTRSLSCSPIGHISIRTTDVDRYTIEGQLRQMMISPRELDLTQLAKPERLDQPALYLYARLRRGDGGSQPSLTKRLPVLVIKDAPPEITLPGLKLTQA